MTKLVYAAVLGFVVIDNYRVRNNLTHAEHRADIFLDGVKAYEEIHRRQNELLGYLSDVIDKHGIETDDFDLIAINYYAD